MQLNPLSPALLKQMNSYWQKANQLALQQVYLYDNPQLKSTLGEDDQSSRQFKSFWPAHK